MYVGVCLLNEGAIRLYWLTKTVRMYMNWSTHPTAASRRPLASSWMLSCLHTTSMKLRETWGRRRARNAVKTRRGFVIWFCSSLKVKYVSFVVDGYLQYLIVVVVVRPLSLHLFFWYLCHFWSDLKNKYLACSMNRFQLHLLWTGRDLLCDHEYPGWRRCSTTLTLTGCRGLKQLTWPTTEHSEGC